MKNKDKAKLKVGNYYSEVKTIICYEDEISDICLSNRYRIISQGVAGDDEKLTHWIDEEGMVMDKTLSKIEDAFKPEIG